LGVSLRHIVQEEVHDVGLGEEVGVMEEEEEALDEGRVWGRMRSGEGAEGVFDPFAEATAEGA